MNGITCNFELIFESMFSRTIRAISLHFIRSLNLGVPAVVGAPRYWIVPSNHYTISIITHYKCSELLRPFPSARKFFCWCPLKVPMLKFSIKARFDSGSKCERYVHNNLSNSICFFEAVCSCIFIFGRSFFGIPVGLFCQRYIWKLCRSKK